MFGLNNKPSIGRELLDVPMGEMIRDMAFAIAEAQMRLDENSMEVAEMMGGLKAVTDTDGNTTFKDSRVFFGKERILLSAAVELYNNTTNDNTLKASLLNEFGSDVIDNVIKVNAKPPVSTSTFTPDIKDNEDYYYHHSDGATSPTITWYEYNGTTYEELDDAPITKKALVPGVTDRDIFIPQRLSMLELGFTPTFYQFVDTIIEVKISIKYTQSGSVSRSVTTNRRNGNTKVKFGFKRGLRVGRNVTTSQVNSSYSQKYSYSAEGSSLLRTKLVPIPPPAILEERIEALMEMQREGQLPLAPPDED